MYYFRFGIPRNKDGTIITYSPGWHGSMLHCPQNVTVLLYNDREGYGIAKTEDIFMPSEVEVLGEKDALGILDAAIDEEGIYFGQKLKDRWLPEVSVEEALIESEDEFVEPVSRKAIFCPVCHQFIMWLPPTLVVVILKLTCPVGHEVVLRG